MGKVAESRTLVHRSSGSKVNNGHIFKNDHHIFCNVLLSQIYVWKPKEGEDRSNGSIYVLLDVELVLWTS